MGSRTRALAVASAGDGTSGSSVPPVRAPVSSWERRSNSRGAARRTGDASTGPPMMHAESPTTSSRAAVRTASRDQREVPVRIASRTRLPEPFEQDPVRVETDVATIVNLGMSPMPRQQTQLQQTPRQHTHALPSSSPSAKGTAGLVQDRIRQLNQTFSR